VIANDISDMSHEPQANPVSLTESDYPPAETDQCQTRSGQGQTRSGQGQTRSGQHTKKYRGQKKQFPIFWVILIPLVCLLGLLLLIFLFIIPFFSSSRAPFVIPEAAIEQKDLSFLAGCWNTRFGNLVNDRTKLPIIYTYCFDEYGNGDVSIDEYDYDHHYIDTCKAKAISSFKNTELLIDVPDKITCEISNESYISNYSLCATKNGEVICRMIYDNQDEIVEFTFVPAE
jgi:hypothetical protein